MSLKILSLPKVYEDLRCVDIGHNVDKRASSSGSVTAERRTRCRAVVYC